MAKRTSTKPAHPNILLLAVDSLLADHMSCYGYHRQTTPHIDRLASQGTLFERTYSAHIPTTPGYSSMLTGYDCFSTQVVALRHKGPLNPKIKTLPEICRQAGYNTSCVGFSWNPGSRGFEKYIDFSGWGSWAAGRSPKAQNLNDVTHPEIDRLAKDGKPWFLMLRHMDPHSPYLPPVPFDRMFYHGNECDPANKSMEPVMTFKPFCDSLRELDAPRHHRQGIHHRPVRWRAGVHGFVHPADSSPSLRRWASSTTPSSCSTPDHGETLYDHDCFFDHHGLYDVTLHVPLIIRYPEKIPAGKRIPGFNQHKDLVPTLLELAGLRTRRQFDGRSLMQMVRGEVPSFESEFYITECTWMRKHGWRTAAVEAHRGARARLPLQAQGRVVQPHRRPARGP